MPPNDSHSRRGLPSWWAAELPTFKSTADLARAWQASIGNAGEYVFTPAVAGDSVYVAARDGALARIEAQIALLERLRALGGVRLRTIGWQGKTRRHVGQRISRIGAGRQHQFDGWPFLQIV